MTRVLFTANAMAGHVRPGLPVVADLVDAGHEVFFYTGRKYAADVERAGARFLPYPEALDWDDATLANRSGDKDKPRDKPRDKPSLAMLRHDLSEIFIKPIVGHTAHLSQVCDDLQPDVVVSEQAFMAGIMVAEQRGLPSVLFTVTPLTLSSSDTAPFGTALAPSRTPLGRVRNRLLNRMVRHVLFAGAQREARRTRRRLGLPPLPGYFMDWGPLMADRFLATTVAELEYPRGDLPASVEFVGALLPRRVAQDEVPEWWPDLVAARAAGRPVVHVTQGTIAVDPARLLLPTIEALADQDMVVVATTGGPDPDTVLPRSERPSNLRLERFVPHAALLPQVDLMVTNGGFGGVQTALAHGIPLVTAGTTEDKGEVNARVAQAGAGVNLRTDRPSAEEVRRAVLALLDEPAYAEAAARLRAAYAAHDGPSRVVEVVLELATDRQASPMTTA
jgi:MGT family glycosyltransferase